MILKKYVSYSALVVALSSLTACTAPVPDVNPKVAQQEQEKLIALIGRDVFFRNDFSFTDGRSSSGASTSLLLKDDKVFALTAKHLLGPAMGIEPAVSPTDFDQKFVQWNVFHNDAEYYIGDIIRITSPNDDPNEDIILLETDITSEAAKGQILTLSDNDVEAGDRVFVIGCPYSEENCHMNIYGGTAIRITSDQIEAKLDAGPDSVAGFSGAAMLNIQGEVIAVVWGGTPNKLEATRLPDWLID